MVKLIIAIAGGPPFPVGAANQVTFGVVAVAFDTAIRVGGAGQAAIGIVLIFGTIESKGSGLTFYIHMFSLPCSP